MINRDDLKDHLRPSPVCIKTESREGQGEVATDTVAQLKDTPRQQSVEISLTDCLACSGCITSAETVLVSQHTSSLFLRLLLERKEGQPVIVTVSPQSRAAIAHRLKLDSSDELLCGYLKSVGRVDFVFDSNYGRAIVLLALWQEFAESLQKRMVVLTSACPGWICYVEKMQAWLIPCISKVRSPQQVMGAWVRRRWPECVHVAVMPCFDKKLEASRRQFSGEIDCVLTSAELGDLMCDCHIEIGDQNNKGMRFDRALYNADGKLASNPGSGSGGYLEYIMHRLQVDMHANIECTRSARDMLEYRVNMEGHPAFMLAAIYGFSNIQTLVRRCKGNLNAYAFVEVMACPGGCLNGGGQLAPGTILPPSERKRYLEDLNTAYRGGLNVWPEECLEVLDDFLMLRDASLLTTDYAAVEDDTGKSGFKVKW